MQLVLNNYGISLSRENEAFIVVSGESRRRVPVVGVESILINKGASITSDAIQLAVEHDVEILFLDKTGTPYGRVWSAKYGSVSTIRKGQIRFAATFKGVDWIREMILKKVENQQSLLVMMVSYDTTYESQTQETIDALERIHIKISKLQGNFVSDIANILRGLEGLASKLYFEALNVFLPEQFRFEQRSQHPATDVVNALLNYGYGILYGKIEGALIEAGIDPYIGILHRDDYNRPVLVYDVIEQYRIWVDYVVYSLVIQNNVTDDYYQMQSDGACWLETLGRRVLIQSLNDYLDEIIVVKGVSRSRKNHISLYAQNLAQTFKMCQE